MELSDLVLEAVAWSPYIVFPGGFFVLQEESMHFSDLVRPSRSRYSPLNLI
jgi:hypothetical protein